MKLARKYYVSGVVQGVGFRYFTYKLAQKHHITGSVCNLADGRVEIKAEGEEASLEQFIAEVRVGPRLSVVQDIQVADWRPAAQTGFYIE